MTGVHGARTIKRQRRMKGAVEQLERQILDVLEEDHPQSIRHLFYRMTNPRLPEPVAKTELGYRTVQNRLKLMRRAGSVPYGWISDSTRRGYHTATYNNGAEFLRRHIGAYRTDLLADAEAYVEVWCESRSIAGTIVDLCEELAVSLYPAGGFSSITFAYEAADFIRSEIDSGKSANVIYIGDYDPAGVLIDRSIETELRRHLRRPSCAGIYATTTRWTSSWTSSRTTTWISRSASPISISTGWRSPRSRSPPTTYRRSLGKRAIAARCTSRRPSRPRRCRRASWAAAA